MQVEMLCIMYKRRLVMAAKTRYNVFQQQYIKILEFVGFCKSGSTKWQKPGTLSHDDSLEISQTENPLHNNCVLLTHLKIDTCCIIVHCVIANISVNWRTTISLLATPTHSGKIKIDSYTASSHWAKHTTLYRIIF